MQNLFIKKTTAAMWHTLRRFAGNRADGVSGVAAVEFAIVVPPLLLMMVCTADLGFGMYRKLQVQNAAQAGAEYAIAHGYQFSSMSSTAVLTNITTAVTGATAFLNIAATPAPSQFYGCPSTNGVTAVNSGSTCSDGSVAGTYFTVSAKGTYTTLVTYPVLPDTFIFASQSTVRIQ